MTLPSNGIRPCETSTQALEMLKTRHGLGRPLWKTRPRAFRRPSPIVADLYSNMAAISSLEPEATINRLVNSPALALTPSARPVSGLPPFSQQLLQQRIRAHMPPPLQIFPFNHFAEENRHVK